MDDHTFITRFQSVCEELGETRTMLRNAEQRAAHGSGSADTAATASLTEDLVNALAAGLKIEAIKAYRALTGEGLKEAKDAIERIDVVWGRVS